MWRDVWKTAFSVGLACFVLAGLSGCGGDKKEGEAARNASDQKQQRADTETTSVAASKPTIETSPADPKSDLPPQNAPPDVVCQTFLALLQSNKRMAAENLLTRTALAVTGRADLQLEPLGSHLAKYELAEPLYATNKLELAQVACKVIDVIDGERTESELTWLVRRQNEGWRISGIMLQLEADKPQDLLSFENYNDVLKIKSSLVGDDSGGERQASAADETSSTK